MPETEKLDFGTLGGAKQISYPIYNLELLKMMHRRVTVLDRQEVLVRKAYCLSTKLFLLYGRADNLINVFMSIQENKNKAIAHTS